MYFQFFETVKQDKTVEILKSMEKYTLLDIKVENCNDRMAIVYRNKYDPATNTCHWQAKHIKSSLADSSIAIDGVDGTFHYIAKLKDVPNKTNDTLIIVTDDGMLYTIIGLEASD